MPRRNKEEGTLVPGAVRISAPRGLTVERVPDAPPVVHPLAARVAADPDRYLTVEIVGVYGHIGYAHLDLADLAARLAARR